MRLDYPKNVENHRQQDPVKTEKIESGENCIGKQQCEAKCKQESGVKEECAVPHREITVQRAKRE
jgi:coenzyme F420-reducing hydrogenase gamma subunit